MKSFHRRLRFEALETRRLLAADLVGGVLTVTGSPADDEVEVSLEGSQLLVDLNDQEFTFNAADVSKIVIDLKGGDDEVDVDGDVLIPTEILGGRGDDDIHGGGDDDEIHGNGGDDDLFGGDGDDLIEGDGGDDHLNGQDDDDLLDGDGGQDHFRNGLEVDFETDLEAFLTGVAGASGEAEFGFEREEEFEDGIVEVEEEWEFELEVEGLAQAANSTVDVYIDGVLVGQMEIDAEGEGELDFSRDEDDEEDDEDDEEDNLPENFPLVHEGSVITVRSGDTVLLQGTFGADDDENEDDDDDEQGEDD